MKKLMIMCVALAAIAACAAASATILESASARDFTFAGEVRYLANAGDRVADD